MKECCRLTNPNLRLEHDVNHILSTFFCFFLFIFSDSAVIFLCVCVSPDEVYAQKLKGKALSEELDLALNDMTTL